MSASIFTIYNRTLFTHSGLGGDGTYSFVTKAFWSFEFDTGIWTEHTINAESIGELPGAYTAAFARHGSVFYYIFGINDFAEETSQSVMVGIDLDTKEVVYYLDTAPLVTNYPYEATCPMSRSFTMASAVGDYIILFGGEASCADDAVWAFNAVDRAWDHSSLGFYPVSRVSPSVVKMSETKFAFYGGVTRCFNEFSMNDLWTFSLDSKSWTRLSEHSLYDPENPKRRPPPSEGSILEYSSPYIYVLGGAGDDPYPDGISYRFNQNSESWEWYSLASAIQHIRFVTNQAYARDGTTLIIWGGKYADGYDGEKPSVTDIIYLNLKDGTFEKYASGALSTRVDASGFLLNGDFCVQGGDDLDGNLVMEIQCFNKASKSWRTIPSSGDGVDKIYRSSFLNVGAGLLVGGEDETNTFSADIRIFNFGTNTWGLRDTAENRPPPFRLHKAISLKNWVVVIGADNEKSTDPRIFGYNMGAMFCTGEQSIDPANGVSLISDGSGDFGYLPFTTCSWVVSNTNNLIISQAELDQYSILDVEVLNSCGDLNVYINDVPKGSKTSLAGLSQGAWVKIPGEDFRITFKSSERLISKAGFSLSSIYCPDGFQVEDMTCVCQANNYITPSGECYPCEENSSQPDINKHFCIPDQDVTKIVKPIEISVGTWSYALRSLPSCLYSISVNYGGSAYILCLYSGDSLDETRTVPVTTLQVSSSVSLEYAVLQTPSSPPSRKGACAFVYGESIIYIGGRSPSVQDTNVYELDMKNLQWKSRKTAPFSLAGHACAMQSSNVYIHGGESDKGNVENSVYIYDAAVDTWRSESWQSSPSLSYHVGWMSGNNFVVFGGYDGTQELDVVYKANLATKRFDNGQALIPDKCLECAFTSIVDCQLPRQMMAYTQHNDHIYIFGGVQTQSALRDLLVFNKDSLLLITRVNYMTKTALPASAPPQVLLGSMASLGGNIILFGGVGYDSGLPVNSLWSYNPERDTWLSSSSVQKPLQRRNFSWTSPTNNTLVIFGGVVALGEEYATNDMWLYKTDFNQWVRVVGHVANANAPSPRFDATIIYAGGYIYVLGGNPEDDFDASNLWRISITPILSGKEDVELGWEKVENLSSSLLRNQHILERSSFATANDGSHFLFWGGQLTVKTGVVEDYRATFSFDPTSMSMATLEIKSDTPTPRSGHVMVTVDSKACIYGGRDFKGRVLGDVWCLSLGDTREWSRITSDITATVFRYNTLATVFADTFVIFGGFDESNKRTNTFYQFQLDLGRWVPLVSKSDTSSELTKRSGHGGMQAKGMVLAFGGSSETYFMNSVSAIMPGLCKKGENIAITSKRTLAFFEDSTEQGRYPAGTNCRYMFTDANHVLINASLGANDIVSIYDIPKPSGQPSLITQITSSQLNVLVRNPNRGFLVVLDSPGSLLDGLKGDGLSLHHINCPTGASFEAGDCKCGTNTFENTLTNNCDLCTKDSTDPSCPVISDSEDNTVMSIAIGASVGALCLVGAVAYRSYHIKMKAMSSREKQLFMHVDYKDLEFGRLLGTGSFGEVYIGKWRGSDVAIKKIIMKKVTPAAIKEFESEVTIMVELRHPNIVLYMAACIEPKNLCIVSELMTRGSLYDILHNDSIEIDESMRLSFVVDAAKGLQYLHLSTPPILHRDLKSPNLLLDEKWNCKISDFGLTGVQEKREKDSVPPGTLFWMAPEVISGQTYIDKSDVYSFGIIIWEVVTREEPYQGELAESVALRVASDGLRPVFEGRHEAPPVMRYVAEQCWAQKPGDRPAFSEVIRQLSGTSTSGSSSNVQSASRKRSKLNDEIAPSGSVALVFTDIQSSTSLWDKYPEDMLTALNMHNEVLREAIKRNNGYEVKTEGDAFMVAFASPVNAVNFVLQSQESLLLANWPEKIMNHPAASQHRSSKGILFRGLRVRMGVHMGEPLCREDPITGRMDYYGPVVNTAARVGGFPKGGQVVISEAVYNIVSQDLSVLSNPKIRDLGEHELKGLPAPEHLYEITSDILSDRVEFYASGSSQSGLTVGGVQVIEGSTTDVVPWQIKFENIKLTDIELGSGSFGVVFLGELNSEKVAVKRFIRQKMGEKQLFSLMSEVILMREIQHPHILRFHGACLEQPNLCLVLEYAPHGSLHQLLLEPKNVVTLPMQKSILAQIASAMRYLHEHSPPIYHRDLKSHNVLMLSIDPLVAKIGDFGLARIKANNQTMTKCGTKAWLAPEVSNHPLIIVEYDFVLISYV
eukprot:TRINITY_DN256_c1_g2_i1.p1 TRINITY_DN256_c1_g2~~TRINITY_DN256_c1_g2_i1.p1  ORF type:complete len:2532 (-),score=481.87 TRINITY_DN256_c1_g2_i1:2062-8733(-)